MMMIVDHHHVVQRHRRRLGLVLGSWLFEAFKDSLLSEDATMAGLPTAYVIVSWEEMEINGGGGIFSANGSHQ